MNLPEKAAYLKGLLDGLDIDKEKPEGKLLAAIVDVLVDMAENVDDIEDVIDAVSDELDTIEEDLSDIEEYLMDEEDDEDDEDFDYDGETIYEVKCPKCGEVIDLDEEMLDAGSIKCPNCGEDLEFDGDDSPEISF
ncbi:MAG: zinc ribbon domain-containing protein [Oscillospiraceae bacterium]|nr:zinc ribbon domain-containing protein [Oscillospiraceae bacterium]